MKTLALITLSAFTTLASSHAQAVTLDRVVFTCQHATSGKSLNFILSPATSVVVFTDVSAMDGAQLPQSEPIGMTVEGNGFDELHLQYDWYYRAEYRLRLSQRLGSLKSGDSVRLTLSGADDDGAVFENETMNCAIQRIKSN